MDQATPTIGDNQPPLPTPEELQEALARENVDLTKRKTDLLAAEARLPELKDDDSSGKVSDYLKQIDAAIKAAKARRETRREPFQALERAVVGWFSRLASPLEAVRERVQGHLTVYLERKDAEERRAAAARAKELREEAERKEAEAQRVAAERKAIEDAEAARLAAAAKPVPPPVPAAAAPPRATVPRLPAPPPSPASEEARIADRRARAAAAVAIGAATAEEQQLTDSAQATRNAADRATSRATSKPGALGRTRGELGSLATLRTYWAGEITKVAVLDLETLRPHLPREALEQAVNAFARATQGTKKLRGARVFQRQDSTVR